MKIQVDKRNFNKAYLPYLNDYSSRYLVFYGGSGSGKSFFVAQRMVLKALQSKRKMLFVRKVAATIRDSIYALTLETLEWLQIIDYCTINKSTYTITLPNGSQIIMKGMDDPEKIKSIANITDVWLEEATELNYNDFLQIDLRVRTMEPDQEIVLSFNPISKANWVYGHFFEKQSDDCRIVKTTFRDNRFLPERYIKTLNDLIRYNEAYYRVYALGEFVTLDKLVFPRYEVLNGQMNEELNRKTLQYSVGLDFGFTNDPTAAVLVGYDSSQKTIYILSELYAKGLTTDGIADALITKGFDKYRVIADSAEPRTISELRRKGVSVSAAKKGRDSVLHGITWLQAQRIVISPTCKNVIQELENYTWQKDKKTNEYYNTPIDDFNHTIDALRYATERYAVGNTVKTYDKSLLGI